MSIPQPGDPTPKSGTGLSALLEPASIQAFLRNIYAAVGSGLAVAVIIGLSQGDATALGNAIHQIGDGIASIASGISALIPILTGLYAAWTATRNSKLTSLAKDPQVVQVVVQDKKVADAVPSAKVIDANTAVVGGPK